MDNDTSDNVRKLAQKMADSFKWDKRNDGTGFYHMDQATQTVWMREVIRDVHGDKLPDDTVYDFIYQTVNAICDSSESDDLYEVISEIEPDIYTHDLTKWLHQRPDHVYYLTQATEEFGPIDDGFRLLAIAQQLQIHEVGHAVIQALEEIDLEDYIDDDGTEILEYPDFLKDHSKSTPESTTTGPALNIRAVHASKIYRRCEKSQYS